jgi:O-acetyl-ADP-ribose deacetylase (regulator of RNase III)
VCTKIEIIQGDITALAVDAIVNAANTTLLGGGGVDGAIHRRAGPGLLAVCAALGGCQTGSAKITQGYDLPARFVIHTVGPVWHGGNHNEPQLLGSCYQSCLALAKEKGLRSLAFPSISTGAYRYPIASASEIALRTVKKFIEDNPGAFSCITFVLFSDADLKVYNQARARIFPERSF